MPIRLGMQISVPRQSYDHRIREAICESRDPDLFPELDIPNSTIRSWLHRGLPDVITSELVDREYSELLAAKGRFAWSDREVQEGDAFDCCPANYWDLADPVSQLVQGGRRL